MLISLAYLDVIRLLRDRFDSHPLAGADVIITYHAKEAAQWLK